MHAPRPARTQLRRRLHDGREADPGGAVFGLQAEAVRGAVRKCWEGLGRYPGLHVLVLRARAPLAGTSRTRHCAVAAASPARVASTKSHSLGRELAGPGPKYWLGLWPVKSPGCCQCCCWARLPVGQRKVSHQSGPVPLFIRFRVTCKIRQRACQCPFLRAGPDLTPPLR